MHNKACRKFKISASILSTDFADITYTIAKVEKVADSIHLDVMDGHFVPSLTFGAKFIHDMRPHTALPFDTHLMINNPAALIDSFIDGGSDQINFHIEAVTDPTILIKYIKHRGLSVGLAIKPLTPIEQIYPYLELLDLVLVMSVEPGAGGQAYISASTGKIKALRERIQDLGLNTQIAVDGGLNAERLNEIEDYIDIAVIGTYLNQLLA